MASIGIFDSGAGGLSVYRELVKVLPLERYLYFSDNAHCPYGEKTAAYIQERGRTITEVLLGLGAAAFYAAVVLLNKGTSGVEPFPRTTVMLLSAGLVMVPYLLFTGGFSGGSFSPLSLLLLLVLGIVHTGVAYALYFGSMDGLRLQTVAVFSYIDPVSALLFSALLLREPLTPLAVLGAVLILGSAVVSELR